MDMFALLWLVPPEVLHDCHCCLLPQTMAMVESIWPSEQLAMALTTPVDPSNLDPADPQVGHLPCQAHAVENETKIRLCSWLQCK